MIPPQYKAVEGLNINLISFRDNKLYCSIHNIELHRKPGDFVKDFKKCPFSECIAGCEELHGKIIIFVESYDEYLNKCFPGEKDK